MYREGTSLFSRIGNFNDSNHELLFIALPFFSFAGPKEKKQKKKASRKAIREEPLDNQTVRC